MSTIDRRNFLRTAAAGLAAGAARGAAHGTKKPNFLFILVDDLGWADPRCFGGDFYDTPNIDRLCREGMKFTDAYAGSPVCSPTRISIMTGKYPGRIDLTNWLSGNIKKKLIGAPYIKQMPLEEVTVAEALKEAGYGTFFAGKWHLGPEGYWPEDQGFDVNKGGNHRGGPYGGKKYFSPYDNPRLADGPPGEHLPDRLARETVTYMEANREKPFLAYLSFYSVHTPLMARADLRRKYEQRLKKSGRRETRWGREGSRKVRHIQNHAVYAGMVEAMDLAVGKVLDALDRLGIADETVVFFMSDNGGLATPGPTSNLPLRAGKGWLYEGGIRESMIVRWPGVTKPGAACAAPVISTDFYPTMLAMAGLKPRPSQHADGMSLVPLLKGKKTLDRAAIYFHYPHYSPQGGTPSSAVRAGDWKLIEFYEDGHVELYNLAADIGEKRDLAGSEPEKAAELKKMLDDWKKAVDAKLPRPNPARAAEPDRTAAPDRAAGPDRSGDFDRVTGCDVTGDDTAYLLHGKETGLALHKPKKPLSGTVTFRLTLTPRETFPANGFLVFGDGPEDTDLVKCGILVGGNLVSIFEGTYPPNDKREEKCALASNAMYGLTVTVDTEAATARLTVRTPAGKEKTVEKKLTGAPKAITYYGYEVIRTATAFAPITVEGGAR